MLKYLLEEEIVMDITLFYVACFVIYSIIGWLMETTMVFIHTKKFINRGFLIGPYCPIYGFGAILMILYLTQYKDNILTVFILGAVTCSILEYLTSYFMELLFKTRWWDYSNHKFNLNGRICGQNSILFGVGGIVIIYITQPLVVKLLDFIPTTIFNITTILALLIMVIDEILSLNIVNKFKHTLTTIDLKKDSTQEFTKVVRETLINNHKTFQKRLVQAYPNLEPRLKRYKKQ